MSGRVRVAFTMQRRDYEALQQAASEVDETVSGYLRKAIATHRYIREHVQSGARIIVELDGIQREVIFR